MSFVPCARLIKETPGPIPAQQGVFEPTGRLPYSQKAVNDWYKYCKIEINSIRFMGVTVSVVVLDPENNKYTIIEKPSKNVIRSDMNGPDDESKDSDESSQLDFYQDDLDSALFGKTDNEDEDSDEDEDDE